MSTYVIAVDFDGTLCENKYPQIGDPKNNTIAYLKDKQRNGAKVVLWTCRINELLDAAVRWCRNQRLIFDAVNQNVPEIIEEFGGDTRKIFANEYIDDRNVMPLKEETKSNLLTWAELEVEIACKHERGDRAKEEWDYGCACYESALKAFKSLEEDGHTGFSIGLTKQILNRLIDGNPLTPIEDTDDIWSDIADVSGENGEVINYQCKRKSSLFKYVYTDGSVEFRDVDRFIMVDTITNTTGHSGLVDQILREKYPITMPYIPADKPYKAVCEEYLTDRKNGDFDTVGIFKVIEPDGTTAEINRYFKDAPNGWEEINLEEFKSRRAMHYERQNRERKEVEMGSTKIDILVDELKEYLNPDFYTKGTSTIERLIIAVREEVNNERK